MPDAIITSTAESTGKQSPVGSASSRKACVQYAYIYFTLSGKTVKIFCIDMVDFIVP
jgi:hypothetical protein